MDSTTPADPVAVLVAHHGAMRRLARSLVYDEHLAAEVAQDAARIALERPSPAGWPAWAWLSGVVRNVARNVLRSERRRRAREGAAAARDRDVGRSPREQAERVEEQRRVLGAVLRLEEPYRGVVIGRFFDDLSIDQIAARSAAPRETVRTRLRRAVERLRADLSAASPREGRGWRFALLPLAGPDSAPRVPVVPLLGGLAMKKVASALVALLLLATGFLLWRVHGLSEDVDRLAHPPEPLGVAAADVAPAPRPPGELLSPRPAAPPASDAGLAQRIAQLEARLEALSARLREMDKARADFDGVIADLIAERVRVNETSAISVSRNVVSAQAQFQQSARADADADGTGEYGGFLEMSGAVAGRMAAPLRPPVMSSAYQSLSVAGEVSRVGYLFRVYLPDARGAGVGEPPTGFDRSMVDAQLTETTWCMYAWPVAYGRSGTRTFFMNQNGDVLATDAASYSGSGAGPAPDAAFVDHGTITGRPAIDVKGADGNTWKQVN